MIGCSIFKCEFLKIKIEIWKKNDVTFHTASNYVFAHMFSYWWHHQQILEGGIQKEQKVRKIIACVKNPILEAIIKKDPLLPSNKHCPYNEACVIEICE